MTQSRRRELPENDIEPETETTWAQGIAREWEADWADPREDIYSATDGVKLQ
jgi:hypothetical protein